MKKVISKTVKFLTLFFVLIFALLITVPLLFKDKISAKVEQTINQYVNAKVEIDNYKLSLFRNFPNISLSLDKVSVSGIGKFENDTLVQLKSINIVFNLSSLFKKTGYEIKSVEFDGTDLNAIVLEDGTANWDIMKETQEETFEEDSPSDMKILLKKVSVLNSSISYIDRNSSMEASLDKLNLFLKGDLTMNETNLNISMNVGEVSFMMEGMKYLNKAIFESIVNLSAKLDSMVFYLEENYLMVNDLKLNFAGMFAMPDDNIETDLTFNTEKTSFKTLLSLIPAIYMKDYDELKTSGEFSLRGTAKGIYSDADSTLPDITLDLVVNNGLISYPSLPEQIRNINISSNLFMAGTDMDRTVVNINKFNMELAGNPFDMTFSIKTPVSDPDISGTMKGRIDLNALSEAVPLDSIDLSGTLDMSLSIAGRLSMIEKEQFDRFKALGNISAKDILVAVTEYPEVKIIQAGMEITPAYTDLKNAQIRIGQRSDFLLNGKLENYIPYLFAEDVIRGFLNLRSKSVDLDEIMEGMVSDTTIADTTSLTVIKIPENIYFDFNASIDQLKYNKILVNNVKGQLVIKDGTLSVSDAGMDLLGGKIVLDAGYDTRDTLSPVITADLNVESLGVKDAYSTFNTIRRLAPFSKGIDGSLSMRFSYKSLLSRNLMPVIHTISGNGKIMSDEITLVESVSYDN
ncbi:MAG: AsmA family protein, partial [Bacteroidales bacterium]|nr:AsmA family protein [Bacteroidales bacterium]